MVQAVTRNLFRAACSSTRRPLTAVRFMSSGGGGGGGGVTRYSDAMNELMEQTPRQYCQLKDSNEVLTFREFNPSGRYKLVFLPGFASDADSWAALLASILGDDHHVIAVNPRGYGGSTNHTPLSSHEDHADDVQQVMTQVLGGNGEKAMVMGYSTGGGTACWTALKYPTLVKAAFLKSSIPLNGQRMRKLSPQGKPEPGRFVSNYQDAVEHEQGFRAIGLQSPKVEVMREFCCAMSSFPDRIPPAEDPIMKHIHKGRMESTISGMVEALVANISFNVTPIYRPSLASHQEPSMVLKDLKTKLIVLHGANDNAIPHKHARAVTELAIAWNWADNNNNEKEGQQLISYYEHSGDHYPLMTVPDEFASVYRRALVVEELEI